MMKRLVVDVCEVVLAGAAVGTFLVVVSGKSWEDCEVVSSNTLNTLRMLSTGHKRVFWFSRRAGRKSGNW